MWRGKQGGGEFGAVIRCGEVQHHRGVRLRRGDGGSRVVLGIQIITVSEEIVRVGRGGRRRGGGAAAEHGGGGGGGRRHGGGGRRERVVVGPFVGGDEDAHVIYASLHLKKILN